MRQEDLTAQQMVSRLLYRDGLMLVIDKPAGIAVHRGPKGGESLEDRFDALRFGLPRRPALAHRLDRDTSGCLVLGRHRKALAQLGKLFKSGTVGKTYWAVVEGGPDGDEGQIELPLGRRDMSRGWWMKHDPAGQPATTRWRVMGRSPDPPPPGEGQAITLACARTVDRTHASASRPLRRHGLADCRRCDLRHGIAERRYSAASACTGSHRAALQKSRADLCRRASSCAYGRGTGAMRLAR